MFPSQVSEEPKVTQELQVSASEARWAPPESQVGVVSGVSGGDSVHGGGTLQGRLGRKGDL